MVRKDLLLIFFGFIEGIENLQKHVNFTTSKQ